MFFFVIMWVDILGYLGLLGGFLLVYMTIRYPGLGMGWFGIWGQAAVWIRV